MKKVRSDNGNEFQNARIDELCDDQGIKHEFSAKYTPQYTIRPLLFEFNVSDSFWVEAINTTCHA